MQSEKTSIISWTPWHQRLHRKIKNNPDLIPVRSVILLAVSGGQDSMVLLKLLLDLKKFYEWKIHVWHGNHNWHQESGKFALELKQWCQVRDIKFFLDETDKKKVSNEETAREWRYKCLLEKAELISKDSNMQCKYILTGHTGSDRAETLIMNLARGANLNGLSSLKFSRILSKDIKLVRPLLEFSRAETSLACDELKLPIWLDPSNFNSNLTRNKIRQKIIPIFEEIHPGSSMRIAGLSESISNISNDQVILIKIAINTIKTSKGIDRKKLSNLPRSLRGRILKQWLEDYKIKGINSSLIEELSIKIDPGKKAGKIIISNQIEIKWNKDSIEVYKNN